MPKSKESNPEILILHWLPVEDAIEAIGRGEIVVVVDDEDRRMKAT